MRKFLAVVLAVVLLLVMVTGCSQPGSPSQEGNDKGADERPVKIGVSMGTTQNLFYSKMAQIIQEHCKARGVECIVSDENNDVNKQIASFENFISSGCTAIIAVTFNADGIKDVVKKQWTAVFCYDLRRLR